MSCELKDVAKLLEANKGKKCLFEKGRSILRKGEVKKFITMRNNCLCSLESNLLEEYGDDTCDNWLQDCLISLSPMGDMLLIASGNNLIVFTSNWDSEESGGIKMKYNICWQGTPCSKSGDITSILFIPFFYNGKSCNGIDWTCIILGFSSGTIKFYTEKMHQLISEVLHSEPITHIKYNSFKKCGTRGLNVNDQETNESICVVYRSVICIINSFSLFQTLRGCRNRLARLSTSLELVALDANLPIDFKKYGFADQDIISDACFIGQTSVTVFDHLVNASLAGGFDCSYRPSPPQSSLIVATGRKPFLGFHYTVEGGGGPVMADVALAVASKIKARLPGWLGFGSSEQEKVKVSQEPAEQLRCRFGLCDFWRYGDKIVTSPDSKLSTVCDSLGRIILIENRSGIARRLWKGYREAQCGFVEVEEEMEKSKRRKLKTGSHNNPTPPRRALFIVIYAPKKGLIEIFTVQHGPRIASFQVPKNGMLIYSPHGLFRFSNSPTKGLSTAQCSVFFISDDIVKEIVVPFHCCLGSDDDNNIPRDLHLMKKIKAILKDGHDDEEKFSEIKSLAEGLKTNEVKMQAVEMMLTSKQITAKPFLSVLTVFNETLPAKDGVSISRNFKFFIQELEKLLLLYIFLKDMNDQPPSLKTVVACEDDSALADALLLTNKEMNAVLKQIALVDEMEVDTKKNAKVSFAEKSEKHLNYFLSCFDLNCFLISMAETKEATNAILLTLKQDLKEEKRNWIGEFFFGNVFYSDKRVTDWKDRMSDARLDPIELIECLISYWISKPKTDSLTHEVTCVVRTLKAVCSLVDAETISVGYSTLSPWWKTIQNYLKNIPCSETPTVLAAFACRAVTITIEQIKEMSQMKSGKKTPLECDSENQESTDLQTSGWENVSKDVWEWDVLIGKLEDVTLLNSVLKLNISYFESTLPKLDYEPIDLSLAIILSKGNGYITETVAKWLAQFGLDPVSIVDKNDVEFQSCKVADVKNSGSGTILKDEMGQVEEEKETEKNETVCSILEYVNILKTKFPYSLTSSSLLANICWEYVVHWYRNSSDLRSLEASVDYLRNVPHPDVQRGMSYLIWTTYVIHKFVAVAKMINEFGKLPSDKFCTQIVSLTGIQIPEFLKLCIEILNILMVTETENCEFVNNQEALWQNEPVGSVQSLVSRALSRPKINDHLLVLHYQLTVTLYMISALNIKFAKVLSSLFENVALTEFFTDLSNNSQLTNHSSNAILRNSRKLFLCKVIAGAVQTIEVVEKIPAFQVAESEDYLPGTRLKVEKCTKWLSFCFELAHMWDIPFDDLRRHHVCELYSSGFDRLAEEVLAAVNVRGTLSSQLLVIAGQRLKTFIRNLASSSEGLSSLSPSLSTWLDKLDCRNLKNHNIQLDDLRTLLSYILQWNPEKSYESQLALAMVESISSLEHSQ